MVHPGCVEESGVHLYGRNERGLGNFCRFLRFPGGCYVEGGDLLKDRFQWKEALGPAVNRPGHWNGNWGYWSTDGEHPTWCSQHSMVTP